MEVRQHRTLRPSAYIEIVCDCEDNDKALDLLQSNQDWDAADFEAAANAVTYSSNLADLFGKWLSKYVLKNPAVLSGPLSKYVMRIAQDIIDALHNPGAGQALPPLLPSDSNHSNKSRLDHLVDGLIKRDFEQSCTSNGVMLVLRLLVAPDESTITCAIASEGNLTGAACSGWGSGVNDTPSSCLPDLSIQAFVRSGELSDMLLRVSNTNASLVLALLR